jgi:ADP-heptose:LPS heptosyltransferase
LTLLLHSPEELDVSPTDVVVLLLWHLGDVLNSTALLPALAERHNREITFVTTKPCAPILENNPFVGRVVVANVDQPSRLTMGMWQALQEFPRKHLARAGTVYNLHLPVNLDQSPRHIVGCWARSLGLDIADEDLRPQFYPTQRGNDRDREPLVVVGAGGYSTEKRWPGQRWQSLMTFLRRDHPGVRIVQLGTRNDPLLEGAEDSRGTTIEESYHVLSRAAVCITHDSFLAHLAPVAHCRTVVIYGPTSPRHFRPLSPGPVFIAGGYRFPPKPKSLSHLSTWLLPKLSFPSVQMVRQYVEQCLSEPSFR